MRWKPGKSDAYHAIRRGSNDRGEAEPYHHPKKRDSATKKQERLEITNLIPEKLIVQVLGIGLSWKFAPDTNESERDFSGHVS
jgi:hypothetical protein